MRGLQITSLVCLGALLALTALRQLHLDPLASTGSNIAWLVIQALPLLAVLPGLLRARPAGYVLTALVAMLYFVHGVQASFGPEDRGLHLLGMAEAALSVALIGFTSYAAKALRGQPGA